MALSGFPPFPISENLENELFVLCRDLKNKKLKNSPWSPFFAQTECSVTDTEHFNKYEISEIPLAEGRMEKNDGDTDIVVLDDSEEMCVEGNSSKRTDILDQVLEDQLLKLKETLFSIKKDDPPNEFCSEVAVFNSISLCQVPSVCEAIKLPELNEGAIAVLLNSLSVLEPAISLITAASIIHHAVHSRMKNWTSDAARTLTTGILVFTKKYPKAVIDELLLPCMMDESFSTSQSDILQDIIKNGVPEDQVLYCLRKAIDTSSPNENTLTAIHCLVERKVPLDASLCRTLTEKICSWSTALNSSVKFSKLLKSLISLCGDQMTEEQLFALSIVIKNNTTYLKRSIENLLRKLIGKQAEPL